MTPAARNPLPPSWRKREANVARLGGSALAGLGGGGVAYLLTLLFNIIIARSVGITQFGAFTFSFALAGMLGVIAPLGTAAGATRYIAIYRGQDDLARLRGVLRTALMTTARTSVFFAALMGSASVVIATRVFHHRGDLTIVMVLAATIPVTALADVLMAGIRAYTKIGAPIMIRSLAGPAARLGCAVLAVAISPTAVAVALSFASAEVLVLFLTVRAARTVFPPATVGTTAPGPEFRAFTRPLALNAWIGVPNGNVAVYFLGMFAPTAAVGLFTASRRFANVANNVFGAFGSVLSPMAADLHAAGQRSHLARLYQTASRWVLAVGMPIFLVQIFFGAALLSLFGPGFTAARPALAVLAAGQLVNYATGMATLVLVMSGHSRLALINNVAELSLSLALDLALIPRYGLLGAAWATAGELSVMNVVLVIEVWRLTGLLPYSAAFAKPLIAGAAAAAAVLYEQISSRSLGAPAMAQVGLQGLTLLGIYAVVLIALGLSDDDRVIAHRLVGQLRRRVLPQEALK